MGCANCSKQFCNLWLFSPLIVLIIVLGLIGFTDNCLIDNHTITHCIYDEFILIWFIKNGKNTLLILYPCPFQRLFFRTYLHLLNKFWINENEITVVKGWKKDGDNISISYCEVVMLWTLQENIVMFDAKSNSNLWATSWFVKNISPIFDTAKK